MCYPELQAAARELLPPFLDPAATQTVIVCNPATVADIVTEFGQAGLELTQYSDIEQSFLAE